MIPSGMEIVTVLLLAKWLNQLRHHAPLCLCCDLKSKIRRIETLEFFFISKIHGKSFCYKNHSDQNGVIFFIRLLLTTSYFL